MLEAEIAERMQDLEGWSRDDDTIVKTYRFGNYHETMAFVNATAWISHRADHHPDLTVGYNQCTVAYTTHSSGGLSNKDFDCAAKVDALFAV
jgi:4a-hydroxytetrahydrobiopterin dehydratase